MASINLTTLAPTLGFLAASSAALYVVGTRRSLRALPPRAKREDAIVLVGAISGQNRGANAMAPPVALVDPYFWLRDDSRSKEEVISHIYPCPKCSKGLLKMRHHICPCDQDKLGSNGVVRISSSGEKGSSS